MVLSSVALSANADPFRQVAPALLEGRLLRVDASAGTVTFPATVHLAEGALEYAIVTPTGAVHESLLVTEVDPVDLHAACLLLGWKPEHPQPDMVGGLGGALTAETLRAAPDLAGVAVRLRITWNITGTQQEAYLENWVRTVPEGRVAEPGAWTYTGSYLAGTQFASKSEGSVVCLVTNPAALINNPRPHHDDDHAWEVNSAQVPAVGTPVTVSIIRVKVPPSTP